MVWASDGQDGDKAGIFAQRFDNTGAKVGGEFQVNTYTTSYQYNPAVAMDSSGNFVVVWGSDGQDGSGIGIFGRRYDSAGAARGGEFQVNVTTSGDQGQPDVASDASGNFVVVWTAANLDGSAYGVAGRRFDASGNPRSGEFPINTYTTGQQNLPRIAMDSAGNFLVAWHGKGEDDPAAPDGFGVFARAFSATGRPSSVEFPVNTFTTGDQNAPGGRPGRSRRLRDRLGERRAGRRRLRDLRPLGRFPAGSGAQRRRALRDRDTNSDTNGVLEPGENVLVEPLWKNTGTADLPLTGTASAFTGRRTRSTRSADDVRGLRKRCRRGDERLPRRDRQLLPVRGLDAGDSTRDALGRALPRVARTASSRRPGRCTSATASRTCRARSLSTRRSRRYLHNGITAGCTPTTYCPTQTVSRGQMAIFIAKGIAGTAALVPTSGFVGAQAYNCVSGGVSLFTDVLPTDIDCKHIHYIAAQNVTSGCKTGQYCPNDHVSRLQMASFIAKAILAPGAAPRFP